MWWWGILYYLKEAETGIDGIGMEADKAKWICANKLGLNVYKMFIDVDNITHIIALYINNRYIVPPIHLQMFNEKSLEILLKGRFDIVVKWRFGQGFMDVINNAMILSQTKHCKIYEEIMRGQNHIQRAIDETGLSDQILLVAIRK